MKRNLFNISAILVVLVLRAWGAEIPTIVIKNHQFIPAQLTVPAGKKLQIIVDNQDPTPEEFESFDLDREQVVGGGKKITVYIGPLKSATYKYWGDFHPDTTKGTIVAK